MLIPLLILIGGLGAASLGQAAETVVISEFMASNHGTLLDEDGDTSDWIEIFNSGTNNVNLGGWFLTDDAANLNKWMFPATNLPPNTFLIVFASGKDRAVAGAPLHTSFNLSSSGEYLALVHPDGLTIATEFAPAFPIRRHLVRFCADGDRNQAGEQYLAGQGLDSDQWNSGNNLALELVQ